MIKYKTNVALFFFFIFSTGMLSAQPVIKIYGHVKDAGKLTPLENVNIIIAGTTKGAVTDKEGNYSIDGIQSGSYTVQASMTGYRTERIKISVADNTSSEVNFYMQPQTYQIDAVNITAPKESRSLLREPYTEPFSLQPVISTVTRSNIQKQGAVNVIDAMTFVPGGLTETRGRQVKQFFSVRGQKYPYPDYALNGVWQQEFEELPYFFSASDIEKIEIVRSSAALLTGLSAIGGLVNIKTREFDRLETDFEAEYGSFNSLHTHLSHGNKIGRFAYATGIGYDRTEGPSGKHSGEAMGTFYTRLNWQASDKLSLMTHLYYLDGKRELRIAEPPADTRYINMIQNFNPYRSILSNVKAVYRPRKNLSSEMQLFYSYRNPQYNDEVAGTKTNEKDIEWGFNFMQSISIGSSNTLRVGGLYDHWIAPNGKRFYINKRCDTETLSGVIVDEQRFGPVTLDAGLRWTKTYLNDYAAFNIDGEGAAFRSVTPLSDIWEPSIVQGSFGASYHTYNRLSINFNSAIGQVKPRQGSLDIDLKVPDNETRLKIDLGAVKQMGNSGRMTITAFGVFQQDAITLSGTVDTVDISGSIIRELYINRDQNQIGLELEVASPRLWNIMESFFNFSVMKSEKKEAGSMVRNMDHPSTITSGGISLKNWNIDLNIFGKYVSPFESIRFAPKAAGPQPLGDYLAIDCNGGYTLKGSVPVRFYFKVRNLTNIKYSTVVGYPDFGRMIYIGMQLKLRKDL
ncbi:MAG: TonB-dependent receptor [Bacteroidales bacterium]|jgi:outer membrane cobalamin receptor|nr:TonB-dependent receptor [Bacteroidales bacterium]